MPRTNRIALLAALVALALTALAPASFAATPAPTPTAAALASTVTATDNTGAVVASTTATTPAQVAAAASTTATAAPQPGALLGAGSNGVGELGQGDVGDESNFWQAGSAEDWKTVAAGSGTSCGIRAPGTLWCWGANGVGQLGLGDVTLRKVPTQVGTATDWTGIAVGATHTCGIRAASGTLLCWGSGAIGKLGTGNSSVQKSPVVVGTGYRSVSLGVDSTCAVKTDATLWCWGYGGSGQLGQGDVANRSVPTQIAGTTWASVSEGAYHSCATRTDGSLWCWGDNNIGEAGIGNTKLTKAPVQVGSERAWASVSAGYDSTCAVKTDRTLWCWGYGGSGQLGQGDVKNQNAPVKVGADADWASVSLTRYTTCARKVNTSLYCWGYNASGQLGLGDASQRNAPVQVTTPITVDVISTGSTATQTLLVSQDTTPVNACPEQPTTKAFLKLGDSADYAPAPGGLFETGTDGWTLKNATVVDGNETLGITAGTKSLLLGGPKLGGVAEAVSPEFCINDLNPTFRYVAKDNSTAAGILYTALRFRPKQNPALMIQVATTATVANTTWEASKPIPLATLLAASLLKKGGTVQLVLSTSSATANTGGVQLDSLLVDPYRRG
ncbi:MAG: hypothetical protein PGN13_03795 [Patulibacter minatonensis]